MQGAGNEGTGITSAGIGPVIASKKQRIALPKALRYEGSTKDWVLLQDSNFEGVTPNEQGVVLALAVTQGSIKSSPTTGHTLNQIVYLGSVDIGSDIANRVYNSNPLKRLIAEGAVSIDSIQYQIYSERTPGPKNRLAVAVYFRDLETDPNRLVTAYWKS